MDYVVSTERAILFVPLEFLSAQQELLFASSCRAPAKGTRSHAIRVFSLSPFGGITPPPLQMLFGREIRKRNSAAEMMAKWLVSAGIDPWKGPLHIHMLDALSLARSVGDTARHNVHSRCSLGTTSQPTSEITSNRLGENDLRPENWLNGAEILATDCETLCCCAARRASIIQDVCTNGVKSVSKKVLMKPASLSCVWPVLKYAWRFCYMRNKKFLLFIGKAKRIWKLIILKSNYISYLLIFGAGVLQFLNSCIAD